MVEYFDIPDTHIDSNGKKANELINIAGFAHSIGTTRETIRLLTCHRVGGP